MSVLDLARADIRALQPYSSARMEAQGGCVFLNANESAWPPTGDNGLRCNRYPDPQPDALVSSLARLYGVRREQLLVGRGSDEAIDLLVRAFCRAERDAVLVQPPTFGMYAVAARIQGAAVIEAPLRDDFALDVDTTLAAVTAAVKLVFVCTPNNPTGTLVSRDAVERLAKALAGRALLVVDEAYIEFADADSVVDLLDEHDNLAVLRTLSKAHALAGARIGCLLAHPEVIGLLRRIMAPYPLPRPCVEAALLALSGWGRSNMLAHVELVQRERTRMTQALLQLASVRAVVPSQANFLAVRFADTESALRQLSDAGIVVRDIRRYPGLADALRITIGTPAENDQVVAVLDGKRKAEAAA